jgi:magnesium transporter
VHVLTAVDEPLIARLRQADEFFWVDLVRPTDDDVDRLGAALDLHPVALEDTREFGQRPKVDPYQTHLLLVFFTVSRDATPLEVHIYVSGGFIATIRREECSALEDLHERLAPQSTHDEELLVYRILDSLTDAYYPVIAKLESQIDELEGDVLSRPRSEQLGRSYRLKQTVRELHRIADAQHDQFRAAHQDILSLEGFAASSKPYLRDVIDHLQQVAGEFQRQTDDLISLTQTYFNANSDRLNKVATRLTIGGTLFLVWTFVTGFFGQNFGWLVDSVETKHDFLVFGVGGLTIPTVILLTLFWVKRRDWF